MTPSELESLSIKIAEQVMAMLVQQPRLVDRHELARRLGVSVPTIERHKSIPYIRLGRRVLYDIDQVVAALSAATASGGSD